MVSSLAELMDEQARAAVKVTGAHHSSWNGTWEKLPPDASVKGRVGWDHTLKYHPEHLVEVLRDMFDRAGQHHDEVRLQWYREAIRVIFHENIHLLAGAGTSMAMGYDAYREPANEVVDEATTELATQNELNNYIAALDLERIAPGISTVRTTPTYGEYRPAVKSFTDEIGERTGLSGAEVIRRMAVVNAEHKLRVAADLLYDKTLSGVVPDQARAGAVGEIVTAMRPPFAAIHEYDPNDPLDIRMSALAGLQAARSGGNKAREIAEYWSANQDLRRSLDAGLGASPPLRKPRQSGTEHEPRPNEPSAGKPPRNPQTLGD